METTTSFLGSSFQSMLDMKQNITKFLDSQQFWTRHLCWYWYHSLFGCKQGGPCTLVWLSSWMLPLGTYIVGTLLFSYSGMVKPSWRFASVNVHNLCNVPHALKPPSNGFLVLTYKCQGKVCFAISLRMFRRTHPRALKASSSGFLVLTHVQRESMFCNFLPYMHRNPPCYQRIITVHAGESSHWALH